MLRKQQAAGRVYCSKRDLSNLGLPFGYVVEARRPEHKVARPPDFFAVFLEVQRPLQVGDDQSRAFEILLQP